MLTINENMMTATGVKPTTTEFVNQTHLFSEIG